MTPILMSRSIQKSRQDIISCHAGGDNASEILTPEGNIPFPIFIPSSFASSITYDFANPTQVKFLEAAQEVFFSRGSKGLQPPQLQKNECELLAKIIVGESFNHTPSYFLPSNHKDIPKVPYAASEKMGVLDMSSVLKKMRSRNPNHHEWVISNPQKSVFLFSEPIVEATLLSRTSIPKLVSRGGSCHHFLSKLDMDHQSFESFLNGTFNVFQVSESHPAFKAFFIAEVNCIFEGQNAVLEHVMVKNFSDKREAVFKMRGSEFYQRITFTKSETGWNQNPAIEKLDSEEAIFEIYMAALKTMPDQKTLLQHTAGRQDDHGFFEIFKTFWGNSHPTSAKLYEAAIYNHRLFSRSEGIDSVDIREVKPSSLLSEALKELNTTIGSSNKNYPVILRRAIDLARLLDNSSESFAIRQETFTPLIKAVFSGSLEMVQEVLTKDPGLLDQTDINGNTPLMVAIYAGKTVEIQISTTFWLSLNALGHSFWR